MKLLRLIYVLEDGTKTYSYHGYAPEVWTEKEILMLHDSLKSGKVFGIDKTLKIMGDMNQLERAGLKDLMAIVDYETEPSDSPLTPEYLR